ncbi:MAG: CotH kinase family protein [Muricoprocola sp.]
MKKLLISALVCSWTMTGCGIKMPQQIQTLVDADESYEKEETADLEYVADKPSWYEEFDDSNVITAYLIVGYGNEADGTDHTWTELNNSQTDEKESETEKFKCEAALQFGDESGPCEGMFGYETLSANASICLHGDHAETKPQKSYRIEIKKGKGSVDGMKKLVFSKSLSDPFRFTEKLCADLMQGIPGMFSTRTRFVHLYVKDKTEARDTKFVDYGLYTMIERIDKTYFKNRDLSKDGSFYKLEDFDWSGYEEITDESVSAKEIVDKWFDETNLYHYLAFHLLTGEKDAATENSYLYQPQGTDRFYFISWDNDNAFREEYEKSVKAEEIPDWNRGIFPLLSSVFYQKILKDETCRSDLAEAVDNLYENYITKEVCEEKVKELARVVKPFLFALPDAGFSRVKETDYDRLVAQLGEQVETNYYTFYETLEKP